MERLDVTFKTGTAILGGFAGLFFGESTYFSAKYSEQW